MKKIVNRSQLFHQPCYGVTIAVSLVAAIVGIASSAGRSIAASSSKVATSESPHFSLLPKLAGAGQPVLAKINGVKLNQDSFTNALTTLYGMNMFQQWVQLTLLKQACQKAGIHVGQSTVDAQEEKVLQQLSAQHVPNGERHAALAKLLAQRGETLAQFRLNLWRSAYILALAKGHVHATKKQIREAYNINFGPKVKAVDIVVGSLGDAVTVRHLVMKEHKDPSEVARAMSIDQQTAQHGGVVIIPLDNPTLPKVLVDSARHLKPGRLSPSIPINGSYHLLWLLGNIPAQNVPMSKVKPIIVRKLTGLLEVQWGQRELARLYKAADIKIVNPILARQYQALRAAALAQQKQAASQAPAGATRPH